MSAAAVRPGQSAWRQVLLAPWRQWRHRGILRFWVIAALLTVLGLAVSVACVSRSLVVPIAVLLAVSLTTIAWSWLVINLLAQNQPAAARLVPGHVRSLRRVLVGSGAAITLVAGLVGLAFGHALLAMGGAALALLAMAWMTRIPLLASLVWVIWVTQDRWSKAPFMRLARTASTHVVGAQPVLVAAGTVVILIAATVGTTRALMRTGDAAHRRSHEARFRRRAAQRLGRADQTRGMNSGHPGAMLRDLSTALYRRVLDQACARRSGGVLGRSLIGLGPQFHWSGQLGTMLTFGVVAGLLWFAVWSVIVPATARGGSVFWLVATGVMTFVIGGSLAARGAFYATRREQALLMLLPGMPRGHALNRALAVRLLLQFAATWALGLLVCTMLVPHDSDTFEWVGMLAAVSLPTCALLLRDWSTLQRPTPMTGAGPVIGALWLAGAIIRLHGWLGVPLSPWTFDLGFGLLTLLLLAWRWRVVSRSPGAFPAGRRD
jgi:hypothetical protein